MLAILFVLLESFTIFLPIHGAEQATGKGIGGPPPLDTVGASWHHRWRPCGSQDDPRCIDAFENDYTLPWSNERAVRAILRRCSNGYVVFMNEPELAGLSYEWQATKIHWLDTIRDGENPSCKIACCGTLDYSLQKRFEGRYWIQGLWDTYQQMYGEPPPLDVIHFHSYYYTSSHLLFARRYIDEVRRVYPPETELWITEYGSLMSEGLAHKALDNLDEIAPLVDRYAWFVSYDPGWEYISLHNASGELTDLGRAYCQRDGTCWPFGGE